MTSTDRRVGKFLAGAADYVISGDAVSVRRGAARDWICQRVNDVAPRTPPAIITLSRRRRRKLGCRDVWELRRILGEAVKFQLADRAFWNLQSDRQLLAVGHGTSGSACVREHGECSDVLPNCSQIDITRHNANKKPCYRKQTARCRNH